MSEIDISGLDKAVLVQALYASAQPLGMGRLHYTPEPLSAEEAQKLATHHIDYCHGRVMKVDVTGDTLDPWGYDRDNGAGTAAAVVAALRAGQAVDVPEVIIPTCAYCDQIGIAQCSECQCWLCQKHGKPEGAKVVGGIRRFSLDPVCVRGCTAQVTK